jgi:hypothetical protein
MPDLGEPQRNMYARATMTSESADAAAVGLDLVRHVQSILPITISARDGASDPAVQLQWIPVRIAGTLEAALILGREGLHEDAAALVRAMADHLITFAWLLADKSPPDRINAWKNNDLRLSNVLREHLGEFGVDLDETPPSVTSGAKWVATERAARECDEFWGPLLSPLFMPGTLNSFSGLYAAVFRGTSPYVHPSLHGSLGFFTTPKADTGQIFLINRSYADLPGTYTQAVVIALLAVWVLTARFRHGDVGKVLPFVDRVLALVGGHTDVGYP